MKTLLITILLILGGIIMASEEEVKAAYFLINQEGAILVNGEHRLYDDGIPTYINGKLNPKKFIGDNETYEEFKSRCIGTPTIGYGTTDEVACRMLMMDDETACSFLMQDIEKVSEYMPKKFGTAWNNLNLQQKAAVISYFYNVGMYSKHPAMLKLMKENPAEVWKQMDAGLSTAKAKGLTGLIARRNAEWDLFKS